jgi:hypothetical protein
LTNVDFPTFGRPTTATTGTLSATSTSVAERLVSWCTLASSPLATNRT